MLDVLDLGLAAEHGFFYRYNSYKNDKWEKMLANFNRFKYINIIL